MFGRIGLGLRSDLSTATVGPSVSIGNKTARFTIMCSVRSVRRLALALVCLGIYPAIAAESDALAISAAIQARHMPFGTVLDPVYASSTSTQINGYTRCGD